MTLTTIDTMLVRPGEEPTLLALWDSLLACFSQHDGFLSGTLLRAIAHEELPMFAPFSHVGMMTFHETVDLARIVTDNDVASRIADIRRVCLLTPGVFTPVRHLPVPVRAITLH